MTKSEDFARHRKTNQRALVEHRWRKYRYGPDPAKWPISFRPRQEFARTRAKTKREQGGQVVLMPNDESYTGVKKLALHLFWDAWRQFTQGDKQDKQEVLKWVNGGPAMITFDTVCHMLNLNKQHIQRAWNAHTSKETDHA